MAAMQPSKEQVRVFMERRRVERTPPPAPDEIRRQLGWGLLQGNDRAQAQSK